ncbi:MAG: ubiquitin-like domain-containing protein [Anaerolineae bacterium]|nr:MAG: ubiquitin-like domain-containing protein [Anaerolineae bacterium]
MQRAPLWIVADGQEVALRSHATTVDEVLAQAELRLDDADEIYLDGVRGVDDDPTRTGRSGQQ